MAYEMKLDLSNRELVIEWRDRSMHLLSQRTVGTPPWTQPLPLRVTEAGETPAGTPILGRNPYIRPAGTLSERAQWYLGFSEVAMPVSVWLDLPLPVRQALFGSSVPLLFFGTPRGTQTMGALDRAAIPVTFRRTPGSYTVPWPYASGPNAVAIPVSWQANPETRVVGPGQSPYLVANSISIYGADEEALGRPLPARKPYPVRRAGAAERAPEVARPTSADLLGEYRPAVTFAVLLSFAIGIWIAVRRTPRLAVLGLTVVAAAGILAMRGRIRPIGGTYVMERVEPAAPGVVRRFRTTIVAGASPIAAAQPQPDRLTAISQYSRGQEKLEVVTSQTAPGHGALYYASAWSAAVRRTYRRELAPSQAIRIRSRDTNRIVLDYQSPIDVDSLFVAWRINGRVYRGQAKLDGAKKGSAAVESTTKLWVEIGEWSPFALPEEAPSSSDVLVSLVDHDRDGVHVVTWLHPLADRELGTYRIDAELVPQADGTMACLFALPSAVRMAAPQIAVVVGSGVPAKRITLSGPAGSRTLSAGKPAPYGRGTQFDGGELAQIAPAGTIIQLIVEPDGSVPTRDATAWIEVSEKTQ
jgi:hypothetical protein